MKSRQRLVCLMTRVTFGLRDLAETLCDDNEVMTTDNRPETLAGQPVDSQRMLESIVYELEYLLFTAPFGAGHDLVQLHGALLAYNLGGRTENMPTPSFGLSGRSLREQRVARAARRIVKRGAGDADSVMTIAARIIEQHLHLIDADLCTRAA
jgi:hypothetical protein